MHRADRSTAGGCGRSIEGGRRRPRHYGLQLVMANRNGTGAGLSGDGQVGQFKRPCSPESRSILPAAPQDDLLPAMLEGAVFSLS